MPIGPNEWDDGESEDTMEARTLTFLLSNKENAFTIAEIIEKINPLFPIDLEEDLKRTTEKSVLNLIKGSSVKIVVDSLLKERKIKEKVIKTTKGKETHYRAI